MHFILVIYTEFYSVVFFVIHTSCYFKVYCCLVMRTCKTYFLKAYVIFGSLLYTRHKFVPMRQKGADTHANTHLILFYIICDTSPWNTLVLVKVFNSFKQMGNCSWKVEKLIKEFQLKKVKIVFKVWQRGQIVFFYIYIKRKNMKIWLLTTSILLYFPLGAALDIYEGGRGEIYLMLEI